MNPIRDCTDSTPSPAGLAAVISAEYGLERRLRCELMQQNLDATYLVSSTSGRYVARLYNSRWWSSAEIACEMDVLAYLTSKGVRVPKPHPTSSGKLVSVVEAPEGLRQLTIVEYLSGSEFQPARDAREYGALVAEVHATMADFSNLAARRGPTLDNLIDDAFDPVLAIAPASGKLYDHFASLKERMQRRVDELDLSRLPHGFCHGDVNFANCVRTDNGRLGLYDFECCGTGLRAYDLAVFRWTQKLLGLPEQIWESFLEGYGATMPEELAAADLLALLRQAWMIGHDARRTALHLLGTRWLRLERPRNYDHLRRLEAEVLG